MSAEIIQKLTAAAPIFEAWAAPDPTVLNQGRRKPPALPLEVLGPWEDWLTKAAAGAGAPPDYVAGPLLVAAANLIGTTRRVSPWKGWVEPCVLWLGSVGDPSSNKSPGADPVIGPLQEIEALMAEGFDEVHAAWRTVEEQAKAIESAWKNDVRTAVKGGASAPPMPDGAACPEEPARPRLLVRDTTPEALAHIIVGNPRGLMMVRDELAGWLESFERYGPGSARAMWLESYGARPFTLDRVKHDKKPIHIPALSVSVFGTTQPDRLAALLQSADDGLAARFLWIWPDPIPPREPSSFADCEFACRAFKRLLSLHPMGNEAGRNIPLESPVERAGVDVLNEFRSENYTETQSSGGKVTSALGKAPGHVLRLALVVEHLWWCATETAQPPEFVSHRAILGAVALWAKYFAPMAARVYGDAALPITERNAATLARWILEKRLERINTRTVCREAHLPGLRQPDAVRAAASVLEDAGWLQPAPTAHTSGRPRGDYIVNPAVRSVGK